MAVDTKQKRFSVLNAEMPFMGPTAVPDGSDADSGAQRALVAWLYSGITIAAASSDPGDVYAFTVYIDQARAVTLYIDQGLAVTLQVDQNKPVTMLVDQNKAVDLLIDQARSITFER